MSLKAGTSLMATTLHSLNKMRILKPIKNILKS